MSVLQTTAVLIGALGLFLVFAALTGLLAGLVPERGESRIKKQLGLRATGAGNWPLMARLGKSFSRIKREEYPNDDDLMDSLIRAGLPYSSPAHFYSRQILAALNGKSGQCLFATRLFKADSQQTLFS